MHTIGINPLRKRGGGLGCDQGVVLVVVSATLGWPTTTKVQPNFFRNAR